MQSKFPFGKARAHAPIDGDWTDSQGIPTGLPRPPNRNAALGLVCLFIWASQLDLFSSCIFVAHWYCLSLICRFAIVMLRDCRPRRHSCCPLLDSRSRCVGCLTDCPLPFAFCSTLVVAPLLARGCSALASGLCYVAAVASVSSTVTQASSDGRCCVLASVTITECEAGCGAECAGRRRKLLH